MNRAQFLSVGLSMGALALGGCVVQDPDPMELQDKYHAYSPSPLFEDGRAMRTPPRGTVPWDHRELLPEVKEYVVSRPDAGSNTYVQANPLPLTRQALWNGRARYETFCATCHGILGDGDSVVGENMGVRPPPTLLTLTDKSDGYIYAAITDGFGYMNSYAGELSIPERWAVVAYVRALQRSQNQPVAAASPEAREALKETK